ncbi:transposase family protein, partial [Labilibacter sediminis]
ACGHGKIHRTGHHSTIMTRIVAPLELLHIDLCGPSSVESMSGKKYILVIVDEFSRFTWVYFLRQKSETTATLIKFIKYIENHLKKPVRKIRSDNGTEFKNKELDGYLEERGIEHNFSAPYTPQQNGVVERKNRSLVEAARSMLNFANLPLYFWAEAIATACFTQNRSYLHKRFNITPYEILNKKKPNLKFLHIFGSRCFIMKMNVTQNKFSSKSDEGIFLGYSHNSKCFRVLNRRTRCVEEHLNISFDDHYVRNPTVIFERPSLFPSPSIESSPCVSFEEDFNDFFDDPETALDAEANAEDNLMVPRPIPVPAQVQPTPAMTPQVSYSTH